MRLKKYKKFLLGIFTCLNLPLFGFMQTPDWMARTEVSYKLLEHQKPTVAIETLQPLGDPYEIPSLFFYQGRVGFRNSDTTYNNGIGYRYQLGDDDLWASWLLGTNLFYDTTNDHSHKRLAIGVEAIHALITFRANYYAKLSGKRVVNSLGAQEQVLSGYDAEADLPVPYLPWLRFSVIGYRWKGKSLEGISGIKAALRADITPYFNAELGRSFDNIHSNTFLKLSFSFGFPVDKEYSLDEECQSCCPFSCRNLCFLRTAKIYRHHDLVIEHVATDRSYYIGRGN